MQNRWMLLLLCMACFLDSNSTVQAQPDLQNAQKKGMVVLLRELSDVRAVQLMNRTSPPVTDYLESEFTILRADNAIVIQAMRDALFQSEYARDNGCHNASGTFSAYLDQATRSLDFLDEREAASLLQQATHALQCVHDLIPSNELARYLFLEGVEQSLRGINPDSYFFQALSIDNSFPTPTRYSRPIQEAFGRAKAQQTTSEKVVVTLEQEPIGLLTRIDGDVPLRQNLKLLPGLHLLQRQNVQGEVLASALVLLEKAESPEVTHWPPAALIPRPPTEVMMKLEEVAVAPKLDPWAMTALEQLPQRTSKEWVLVLLPVSRVGARMGLLLGPQGLLKLSLSPPSQSALTRQRQTRALLRGVTTAVFAGIYVGGVMGALQGKGGETIWYPMQGIGGAGTVVGGVGLSISLWHLFFPPPEPRHKAGEGSEAAH